MNEKLKNAKEWVKAHKKGIAIGVGVTVGVIAIAILLKKCYDSDLEAEKIQEILEDTNVDEVINAWKENGGDELKSAVIDKLKDLHEFAKEHNFCIGISSCFGAGEFRETYVDVEFYQGNVTVDEFTTY